ncbi:MAG TPA: rod shape-determining protein RodA [Acidimicrobiales bacterium]|nr:rod shape-determining protein RodA [Acidimicrobiales bacterium]
MAAPTLRGVRPASRGTTRELAAPWRHIDLVLLGAVLVITALSLVMIYSATRNQQAATALGGGYYLERQAIYVGVGLAAMAVVALIDYRSLPEFAPVLYVVTLVVLLLVVSPLGATKRGSQAWFQLGGFQLEPSEFAKATMIVCLSAFIARHRSDLDGGRLAAVLGLIAVPLVLIYRQPDFGTAMVFAGILLALLLVGGARPRHLGALVLLGVLGAGAVLQLGVLKEYQVARLSAFFNPQGDAQGTSYNLRQSQTTIAAGGLKGKGMFEGSQTNLSFVPEQHTDFIFTAVGEQLGFIGAVTLLALFAIVVWRTWRSAVVSRDRFGTLICVGVLAMIVFQVFENVGMTMGITPVAGIPLPLMSYGGSSTVASFICIGLVLNVHMRRFA